MFPHRSGAEVVYLEQAYPKPRFLVSIMYATVVILTSINASNAIIFAQYFLSAFDIPVTTKSQTIVALVVVFITAAIVITSTRWALRALNVLTTLKVVALAFMVVSGVAVLSGLTRIKDPYANFKHPFEGSSWNGNALSTAMIKSNHSLVGWANAFNLMGEMRSSDPARTVRKASRISLFLVSGLYLFINVAYVAAIPADEIRSSGQLVAVLFFQRIFGARGATAFPLLVSLSCFGNIVSQYKFFHCLARVLREIARQGLLPFPSFFSSIKPFGTPFGPVALRSVFTVMVLLIVPAKDAFNFIMDLVSYPHLVFQSLNAYGVWVLRQRRSRKGMSPAPLRANNIAIFLYLSACILLLVLPWAPPEPGHADVSFWYATYCVGGIILLLFCGLYYWLWIIYLPTRGGYEIVEEVEESVDGVRNTRLTRRYKTPYLEGEQQPLLIDA
ncbi:hypothetical protein HYPSUDRAFT_189911 [Hypholoma sublateritium FD-334 SS-4]|uniref:Amino acid permease/ SLC12A domain-containing protein n=1 Tax=Hypholoma sublateritium (strain FD-334 SS-4) TaxID=945553 RepID=A0A0D2NKR3_HYPSF|nr:hypothetical protein HYPSUDRAFT_189911 [Hypholoma sublateritium FD-334 SS-4]